MVIPPESEIIHTHVRGSQPLKANSFEDFLSQSREDALLSSDTEPQLLAQAAGMPRNVESLVLSVGVETNLVNAVNEVALDDEFPPMESLAQRVGAWNDGTVTRSGRMQLERPPRPAELVDSSPVTMGALMACLDSHQSKLHASIDRKFEVFLARTLDTLERRTNAKGSRKRHVSPSPSDRELDPDTTMSESDDLLLSEHSLLSSVGLRTPAKVMRLETPGYDVAPPLRHGSAPTLYSSSLETAQFEQAKARIADLLPGCELRRKECDRDDDLYQTNLPNRLDPQTVVLGPPTLPVSTAVRRGYEICNQQLRRDPEEKFKLRESYDPIAMLRPASDDAKPLKRGNLIPLHQRLSYRRHDFPVEPHGTAMNYSLKSTVKPD
jgi:hypothetical protein